MKVQAYQCRKPSCRGCGKHVGEDHDERCFYLQRELKTN